MNRFDVRRRVIAATVAGQTNQQIVRHLGVHLKTVINIRRDLRQGTALRTPNEVVRCGSCGALVLLSAGYCRACWLRRTQTTRPRDEAAPTDAREPLLDTAAASLVEVVAGPLAGALARVLESSDSHVVVELLEEHSRAPAGHRARLHQRSVTTVPTPAEIRHRAAACRRRALAARSGDITQALRAVRRLVAAGSSCYAACRQAAIDHGVSLSTLYARARDEDVRIACRPSRANEMSPRRNRNVAVAREHLAVRQ